MIYMIYNDRYVAAIVEGTLELKRMLENIPVSRVEKQNLRVENLHWATYPFKIIEVLKDGNRVFLPTTSEQEESLRILILQNRMKILATYNITKDFHGNPVDPGLDYMGILDHEHEDEDEDEDETY